jgi:hypothetical protein
MYKENKILAMFNYQKNKNMKIFKKIKLNIEANLFKVLKILKIICIF